MSLEYIRTHYKVPAKRGGLVIYAASDGEAIPGRITGAHGARLRVRLQRYDGTYNRRSSYFHPTWHMTYLLATQPTGASK